MQLILTKMVEALERNEPLATATIISRQGSAPRRPGTKMLIDRTGKTVGSIGGGRLEAEMIKAAVKLFEKPQAVLNEFRADPKTLNHLDSLCGGQLRILIELVRPEPARQTFYKCLREAVSEGRRLLVAVDLDALKDGTDCLPRCLIFENGSSEGEFLLAESHLKAILEGSKKSSSSFEWEMNGRHLFIEFYRDPGTVYLFGSGYVSRAVAELAPKVGFSVIVVDDRDYPRDLDSIPNKLEFHKVSDFRGALKGLAITGNSYLVIATRGHSQDRTVLAQALRTPARYIGMIGSKKKRAAIFDALNQEGFTDKDLGRVHCPIGLPIGAETPEEIAVSIIAELISERRRRLRQGTEAVGRSAALIRGHSKGETDAGRPDTLLEDHDSSHRRGTQ